jgi:hypothetical protein
MLTGGLDGQYRAFLAGPHKPTCRVEVWAEGVRLDDFGDAGVPITSGSVSASLQSRVARTAQLGLTSDLFPEDEFDLLAPFGNYLKIFKGVDGYGGPSYEWQVFYGPISDIGLTNDGSVVLDAIDVAGEIAESFFATPRQSNVDEFITTQFRQLIEQALPAATFGTFDTTYARTPNLIWQTDRASACDQLAAAANMYWYPLANGDFVMRTIAWDGNSPSLLTMRDGPGGTMGSWAFGYNRTGVYNNIFVVGERADGSTPVYGSASDGDPTSPTFIGGKFGVKAQQISVQTVTSPSQAQQVARSYLRQTKSITQPWAISCIADAALELGDALTLIGTTPDRVTHTSSTQVVAAFTLPLTKTDGNMTINFRAQQPGAIG